MTQEIEFRLERSFEQGDLTVALFRIEEKLDVLTAGRRAGVGGAGRSR
jgi:hypothetical protein